MPMRRGRGHGSFANVEAGCGYPAIPNYPTHVTLLRMRVAMMKVWKVGMRMDEGLMYVRM